MGAACAKVKFGAKQDLVHFQPRPVPSEIKSEHTDGVIRRELVLEECALSSSRDRCILVQRKVCPRVVVILHLQ